MGIEKQTKLNHLMQNWPDGKIKSSVWLKAEGYGANFIQKYKSHNWIEAIGSGAYKKPGDQVTWASALECIQKQIVSPDPIKEVFDPLMNFMYDSLFLLINLRVADQVI